MSCCTPQCQKWTAFSISLVLILFGTLIFIYWGAVFDKVLKHELTLANTRTEGFVMWRETPIPMYMEFYLWNFTNIEEVVASNWQVKPKLEECGPYTYKEKHYKENVTFNDNNNTVTYFNKRVWHFDAEKTNGSLEDMISTINPIMATASYFVRNKHIIVRRGVNFFAIEKKVDLFVTKTVREFLFDGYYDPLLDLLKKLKVRDLDMPFQQFGWFADRNNSVTYDGAYNMFTGADDSQKTGRIYAWNYQSRVNYYEGNCGKVEGTSGEFWYPPKDDKLVKIFVNDACSTFELVYKEDIVFKGIHGRRYIAQANIFDNGTTYAKMSCFRHPSDHLASGVRNVSDCKFHAPAFLSFPHFYTADPSYTQPFEGMNPDPKKHQLDLALHPTTGLPLSVKAAMQVNLKIGPVDGFDILKNVTPMYLPVIWFRQTAELSDTLSSQIRLLLTLPTVGNYTGIGMIVIGVAIILITMYLSYKKVFQDSAEGQKLM